MGLTGASSGGMAALCATMVFAALQMWRQQLAATRLLTLVAGYASSWIFVFLLIAVNSMERLAFGDSFHAQLPEVVFCGLVACASAAMVHRVSCTVCLLCSCVALYFIGRLSAEHSARHHPAASSSKRRK